MRKHSWIIYAGAALLAASQAWAGWHLGLTRAVRNTSQALDQKVRENQSTPTVTPTAAPTPILHEGDLIVQGQEELEIKDCSYTQKGNIIIRDQGVLRIIRSQFTHQAESLIQYDLNCEGDGRLEVTGSTLSANSQYVWWRCLDRGTATFQQTTFSPGYIKLWALGQGNITVADSNSPIAYATENGVVTVTACISASVHPKKAPANPISVEVSDWGNTPVCLKYPVNDPCPQDAIEISSDGAKLYYMYTTDLLSVLGAQMLNMPNGTYVAARSSGPDQFLHPQYFNLRQGAIANLSLDGECSFTADGSRVFFHSNRPDNLGYQGGQNMGDFHDTYVAALTNGVPGPGVNLGSIVNSIYPDGEHAVTADGSALYLSSNRPGGAGGTDIYISQWNGSAWSAPVNAGNTINSAADDLQPFLSTDGQTMYFTTERNAIRGIYRSTQTAGVWSAPELVIKGAGVGEASLTADGQYLYFVYVYVDSGSEVYDADIYYVKKK